MGSGCAGQLRWRRIWLRCVGGVRPAGGKQLRALAAEATLVARLVGRNCPGVGLGGGWGRERCRRSAPQQAVSGPPLGVPVSRGGPLGSCVEAYCWRVTCMGGWIRSHRLCRRRAMHTPSGRRAGEEGGVAAAHRYRPMGGQCWADACGGGSVGHLMTDRRALASSCQPTPRGCCRRSAQWERQEQLTSVR